MKQNFSTKQDESEWKVLHQRTNIISPDKSKKSAMKDQARQRSSIFKVVSTVIQRLRQAGI